MYKIIFSDNSTFLGGNLKNTKWKKIPDKEIKSLEFEFPDQRIFLEGYESYNFFFEKALVQGKGLVYIGMILMAKKEDDVLIFSYKFTYDSHQPKHPINKTTLHPAIFGKEYERKATHGWKKGLKSNKPKSLFI